MEIDHAAEMSILYDFYGQLLTQKQNQIFKLYHEDNLTLSEIGNELGVSRQGVHDALKKAEAALSDFEKKLGLVKYSSKNETVLEHIEDILAGLCAEKTLDVRIKKEIRKIKDSIDQLNV